MSSPFESRLKHGRADVNRKAPDDKVSSLVPQPRQFQRDTMLTERAVVGFKEQSVVSCVVNIHELLQILTLSRSHTQTLS